MNINVLHCAFALSVVMFAICEATQAEIRIVTPSELDGVEGSSQTVPIGGAFRGQRFVLAGDFASLPPSHRVITGAAFRPDMSDTFTRPITGPVRFLLSTTTVDGLDPTFSSNYGPDPTVVFDGVVTWLFGSKLLLAGGRIVDLDQGVIQQCVRVAVSTVGLKEAL